MIYSLSNIKLVLILWCAFVPICIQSQNLLKNPSFEAYLNCPEKLGNFNKDVEYWSIPTEGSTDYFNVCSTAMGTPKNFNGTQLADFGKGYAGLYLYAPNDYREYLQAELSQPLVKGEKYTVSFHVSLAERSDFAIKEFGVLFSKDKLGIKTRKELSKRHWYSQKGNDYNYMEIGYSNFYSDKQDWILVHTQFVAKGTEKYLILGNFKTNGRTRKFNIKKNAKQGAYYYVDMVMVKPLKDEVLNTFNDEIATNEDAFELNKTHTFKNVLFAFDKFVVLEVAKPELREIFDYLKKNASLTIKINGHTDNVGSDAYNRILSSKRARAVADYLSRLGIKKDRIICQGYGGAKPIANNTTEQGRQQNRRVEFVITAK